MQRRNVVHHRDYTKIPQDEGKAETDNIEDLRFQTKPQTIPWATICFVFFLFMGGTCCLLISFVIFIGHWDTKYDDRAWPAFILGWIMFIPGAYYMKVIICAFFNICDHKFEDIPHFNN